MPNKGKSVLETVEEYCRDNPGARERIDAEVAALESQGAAPLSDAAGRIRGWCYWAQQSGDEFRACTPGRADPACAPCEAADIIEQYERQREELRALVEAAEKREPNDWVEQVITAREIRKVMQFDTPARGER